MLTKFPNLPHCSQAASKIKHHLRPQVLLSHFSFIFLTLDATKLYHWKAPSSNTKTTTTTKNKIKSL
jgi:hypothetical protein